MADFMAGWSVHQSVKPHTNEHVRSQSSVTHTASQLDTSARLPHATSTSSISPTTSKDSITGAPLSARISHYNDDDHALNTIPDPRSRSLTPVHDAAHDEHGAMSWNDEVSLLSNKLINALNYQTNLDQTLSSTRHELETSRERIRQLELESAAYRDQVGRGVLIKSASVEEERTRLTKTVAMERRLREDAEKATKKMELELEDMTTSLFEEANKLVIAAREQAKKEHDAVVRKNDQLKSSLADTETLLRSHQEQLAELKGVMEQLHAERDDTNSTTAPSTPGFRSKFDTAQPSAPSSAASGTNYFEPSYPTSFTHLLQPVLRTDLAAYEDFTSLLRISKMYGTGSRVSSGSYGGFGLGLGLGAYTGPSSSSTVPAQTSNGSSSSLPNGTLASPQTPSTPASPFSATSPAPALSLPLKETRFYKRALAEDIEPTLRLDTAPGLSWLARRSVLNSMCEGSLVVEPTPISANKQLASIQAAAACSLCGEARKSVEHLRTHRFRTSEDDKAQRYPLCKWCLGRVRASCDFLGFLRVVKDGHWRTDGDEEERAAWEEAVRLRERMFWCRMGGGVVPIGLHAFAAGGDGAPEFAQAESNTPRAENGTQVTDPGHSPRRTAESDDADRERAMEASLQELERTGDIIPRDVTAGRQAIRKSQLKPSGGVDVSEDESNSEKGGQLTNAVAVSSEETEDGRVEAVARLIIEDDSMPGSFGAD